MGSIKGPLEQGPEPPHKPPEDNLSCLTVWASLGIPSSEAFRKEPAGSNSRMRCSGRRYSHNTTQELLPSGLTLPANQPRTFCFTQCAAMSPLAQAQTPAVVPITEHLPAGTTSLGLTAIKYIECKHLRSCVFSQNHLHFYTKFTQNGGVLEVHK